MAWFSFTDASREVFVAEISGRALVTHARALVAGTKTADMLIGGTVETTPRSYNIGWSFHLDPASIFFFEVSAEVGDSTMRYIESHLDEVGGAFLPGNNWTGWSSRMLDELAPQTADPDGEALMGSGRADILFGGAGRDRLDGHGNADHLIGGGDNDRLRGGAGGDKLAGGVGGDTLSGGSGADVLDGGRGTDHLIGGDGRDRFVFAPGSGHDRIVDFAGADIIDLRACDLADKGDIALRTEGDDLILDTGSGTIIRLVSYLDGHAPSDIAGNVLI